MGQLEMKLMSKISKKDCKMVTYQELAAMVNEHFIKDAGTADRELIAKAAKGGRFKKYTVMSKSGRYIFQSEKKHGIIVTSRPMYIEDRETNERFYMNRSGYHKRCRKLIEQYLGLR
ncbi:MAG: hypothetical protein IJT23_00920 [Clostridia bacterium]|nr:hypothetical protein [Clostridia bacterium]